MDAPTRGTTRIARACAFGMTTLALAAGAHVVAGGALPSMTVLTLLAVPVAVAALALTSRRCGPVVMLVSLTGAQVLLHETLMALAARGSGGMAVQMSTSSSGAIGDFAMSPLAMSHSVVPVDGWSVAMTATHLLATVVTALLLARGEQALWQLVARLLPTLPCIPRLPGCGPRQAPVLLSVPALRPCLVSGGSGLRGPPARFAAAAQVL
jgi:hypothetical protein